MVEVVHTDEEDAMTTLPHSMWQDPEAFRPKEVEELDHGHHAEHDHEHGEGCGHEAIPHDDHVDYEHEGHRHWFHHGHWDEH